ncbi:acetoacetate decarboxylase family protein [Metallosphaera javensis (ex Sakai et al. 2022)]|uniref:acetoacetate decarboxylase family protein n=1 Tax=Metallosphaera javensis (ex Sakai et al. 2022) TaxID=2775498 RepID=UPI002585BBA5|nr:MAG: acetoacetate decarboxylase [Metallosphaera javensis (ex Sakai et al. 2022)]
MSFTLPITRTGNSSIVPPPPYYYGVTYIASHVKFECKKASKILPEYLTTDGEGWIYVAEFISVMGEKWENMYMDPDLTQYMEGAIGLKVNFEGKNYLYYPFMWVDKDWALVRGWLDGYPKKLAKISMTKLHPLLPKYDSPKSGIKLGGYVVRGGGVMFRLRVELAEKAEKIPVSDFGPFLNIRRFPSRGDGEEEVYELVSRVKEDSKLENVWKGNAEVELGGYINDEVNLLEIEKIYSGYHFLQYFKVNKTVLLKKGP